MPRLFRLLAIIIYVRKRQVSTRLFLNKSSTAAYHCFSALQMLIFSPPKLQIRENGQIANSGERGCCYFPRRDKSTFNIFCCFFRDAINRRLYRRIRFCKRHCFQLPSTLVETRFIASLVIHRVSHSIIASPIIHPATQRQT